MGRGFALGRYSLLNGNNMHAYACASGGTSSVMPARGRYAMRSKKSAVSGVHVRLLGVYHHDLSAAGNEHVQHPALFMVGVLAVEVFPVELDKAASR